MSKEHEFIRLDYPLHILQIKLWDWENIKEIKETLLLKHGPTESEVEVLETANIRIKQLAEAIDILRRFNINTYDLPEQ